MSKNNAIAMHRAFYSRDFFSFVQAFYPNAHVDPLFVNWHHEVMTEHIRSLHENWFDALVVNAPPRSLKSFICTICHATYYLAKHPGKHVLIAVGGSALAREIRMKLQRILFSPRYRTLFPYVGMRQEGWLFKSLEGGSIRIVVVGQQLSGVGADVIIVDDPISPSHATDKVSREAATNWLRSEIQTRLNNKKSGKLVYVAHRVHDDDPLAHLEFGRSAKRLSIEAIATRDESWILPSGTYMRKKLDPIHAARESIVDLYNTFTKIGGDNFVLQYQQFPAKIFNNRPMRLWFKRPPTTWEFGDFVAGAFFRMPTDYLVRRDIFAMKMDPDWVDWPELPADCVWRKDLGARHMELWEKSGDIMEAEETRAGYT